MPDGATTLRILHCFGDQREFAAEFLPQRLTQLGNNLAHECVGISREDWRDAGGTQSQAKISFLNEFPSLAGKPTPGRLMQLANAMKPFDLVLSYGWGAIDVAMAHTLFSDALGLPPLIHHETALTGEEQRLSRRRSWYRRVALGKAAGLVVPSERLEKAALIDWQQPMGRVKHFAPGVEVPANLKQPKPDALRGIIKRDGELWIGAMLCEQTDSEGCIDLVVALAELPESWHLVLLTTGINVDALSALAEERDIAHRVHVVASQPELGSVMGLFDIWTAFADGAQATGDALTAMASGKPVLAFEASEAATRLPHDGQESAVLVRSPQALKNALAKLAGDELLRAGLGTTNREYAKHNHDAAKALDRYRRLYASAMKAEIRT